MVLFIILLFVVRNRYTAYPGKLTPSDIRTIKTSCTTYRVYRMRTCYTHSVISRRVVYRQYIKCALYLSDVVYGYLQRKHKHTKIK